MQMIPMQRIKYWLLGLFLCLASLIVSGDSISRATRGRDDAGARAAFQDAYKVFKHARCINCHPAGNAPLQGDEGRLHAFRVKRGIDGQGVFSAKCTNCHQAKNQSGMHAPPGAPDTIKEKANKGESRWHMPSTATPLIFQNRTARQICLQLLDKKQNGGLTPEQLVDHVNHDPLVLWGWSPGEGRTAPELTHTQFVQKVKEWIDKGGACPN